MTTLHTHRLAPTLLAAALLGGTALTAQAARLELLDGALSGGTQLTASATDGSTVDLSAALAGATASGQTLADGGQLMSDVQSLGGGALSYSWSAAASFSADSSTSTLSANAESALWAESVSGWQQWSENGRVMLQATLRVVADAGEADGSAARVDLLALSAFDLSSTLPEVQPQASFELLLADDNGLGTTLRWTTAATSQGVSEELTQQSLDTRFGSTLTLQLVLSANPGAAYDSSVPQLDGNSLTRQALVAEFSVSAVPEPQTWALWLSGLGALLLLRWRLQAR